MKNYPIYYILLLFVISCKSEKDKPNSTPDLSYIHVEDESGDCASAQAKECVDIQVNYPEYNNLPKNTLNTVNEYIKFTLSDFLITEKPIEVQNLQSFVKEIVSAKMEETVALKQSMHFAMDFEQLFRNSDLLCLMNTWQEDEGAGHPMSGKGYSIFNIQSGQNLLRDDIINQPDSVKIIALKKIKSNYDESDSVDISEIGFLISDSDFAVTDNIGITKDSMIFSYTPHEIAPYAYGFIDISFSKSEIKPFLTPNFISWWIDVTPEN